MKNWFGSNVELLKDITQLVQEESDDEKEGEEAVEDQEEEKEVEVTKASIPEPKGAAAVGARKGSQAVTDQQDASQLEEAPAKVDPNANKFIPHVVHFDRTLHTSPQVFNELNNYRIFLKPEDQFGIIMDDALYESLQGDLVDIAFAQGAAFLNLKGFGRPEKSAKVDRFQEIIDYLRKRAQSRLPTA